MTATDRRLTGKAFLPTTGEIREVELFDASPVAGERVEVCTASPFWMLSRPFYM